MAGYSALMPKKLANYSIARNIYFSIRNSAIKLRFVNGEHFQEAGVSVAMRSTGCRGSADGCALFAPLARTVSAGGTNS